MLDDIKRFLGLIYWIFTWQLKEDVALMEEIALKLMVRSFLSFGILIFFIYLFSSEIGIISYIIMTTFAFFSAWVELTKTRTEE